MDKILRAFVLMAFICLLVGCSPEGPPTESTWNSPAAYIPPPADNPAPPAVNEKWIGPDGYSGSNNR